MIIQRVSLLVLLLLLASVPAWAGAGPRLAPDLSRYEGRAVESVSLDVEEASLDEAALGELRARLKVAAGGTFAAVLVRESIQALFDTGRVADVRVEARDAAGAGADGKPRLALRFVIRPQVSVAGVEFEIGADFGAEITEDELRSRVTLLEPGKRLTEQSLKENAEAIVAYLHDRGFKDKMRAMLAGQAPVLDDTLPWYQELVYIDDVVHAVRFLASPDAGFITGQTIVVDGGFTC